MDEETSIDGIVNPSATPDNVPSDPVKAEDDALDAMARESLGALIDPVTESEEKPDATTPEKTEESQAPKNEEQVPPENESVELPPIPRPERVPSRLDRRIATIYQQNLILSGEKNVPSMDELLVDIAKYPIDQRKQALFVHLEQQNKLKGIAVGDNDSLSEEDQDALNDADRQSIREEVLIEQHELQYKQHFVEFISAHPELDEQSKTFNKVLHDAVATLWKGGLTIDKAYETVVGQIEAVKAEHEKTVAREKSAAFSGAISAGADVNPSNSNGPTWLEMAQIQKSDPARYEQLVRSGYEPKE